MSGDEFMDMLRRAVPAPEITDARLDALIDRTVRRARSLPRKSRFAWLRWPQLAPVMQYALPMAVAVVMGVAVDSLYASELPVAQFSRLMLATTLLPSGS
jgi:hypothetical protein